MSEDIEDAAAFEYPDWAPQPDPDDSAIECPGTGADS